MLGADSGRGLVQGQAHAEEEHGAGEVEDVVGTVQGDDVQRRIQQEQPHDANQEVDGADGGVHGACAVNPAESGEEQCGADGQVDHVVQRVHLEDDQVRAFRGDESDA